MTAFDGHRQAPALAVLGARSCRDPRGWTTCVTSPPVGRVDPIGCARTLSLVVAQGDVPRWIPALDEEFLDLIGASGDKPPPLHDVTSNERRVE